MEEKDFSKLWASDGSLATISDDQYKQGWIFIGDNKPMRTQFNAFQQWSDQKAYWLYLNKLGIDDTAKAAEKLKTSRTIKVSGAVKGEAKFDGTGNIEIKTTQNGYDANKAQIGFEQRPSGLMECWGYVPRGSTSGHSTMLVKFPKAFTKSCFNIQITDKEEGVLVTGDGGFSVLSYNTKEFTVLFQIYNSDTGAKNVEGFFWRAIGE